MSEICAAVVFYACLVRLAVPVHSRRFLFICLRIQYQTISSPHSLHIQSNKYPTTVMASPSLASNFSERRRAAPPMTHMQTERRYWLGRRWRYSPLHSVRAALRGAAASPRCAPAGWRTSATATESPPAPRHPATTRSAVAAFLQQKQRSWVNHVQLQMDPGQRNETER